MLRTVITWATMIFIATSLLHYSSSDNPIVKQISFYILITFLMFTIISRAITEWRQFISRNSSQTGVVGTNRTKFYKLLLMWVCMLGAMYAIQFFLKGYGMALKDFDDWLFWIVVGAFGIALMAKKNIRKDNQK